MHTRTLPHTQRDWTWHLIKYSSFIPGAVGKVSSEHPIKGRSAPYLLMKHGAPRRDAAARGRHPAAGLALGSNAGEVPTTLPSGPRTALLASPALLFAFYKHVCNTWTTPGRLSWVCWWCEQQGHLLRCVRAHTCTHTLSGFAQRVGMFSFWRECQAPSQVTFPTAEHGRCWAPQSLLLGMARLLIFYFRQWNGYKLHFPDPRKFTSPYIFRGHLGFLYCEMPLYVLGAAWFLFLYVTFFWKILSKCIS